MPKRSRLRCYFGCKKDGPLHLFPNPNSDSINALERFYSWKSILPKQVREKGNSYIHNSVRICNRHFKECFCLPSNRLTANAIPTLFLDKQDEPSKELADPTDTLDQSSENLAQEDHGQGIVQKEFGSQGLIVQKDESQGPIVLEDGSQECIVHDECGSQCYNVQEEGGSQGYTVQEEIGSKFRIVQEEFGSQGYIVQESGSQECIVQEEGGSQGPIVQECGSQDYIVQEFESQGHIVQDEFGSQGLIVQDEGGSQDRIVQEDGSQGHIVQEEFESQGYIVQEFESQGHIVQEDGSPGHILQEDFGSQGCIVQEEFGSQDYVVQEEVVSDLEDNIVLHPTNSEVYHVVINTSESDFLSGNNNRNTQKGSPKCYRPQHSKNKTDNKFKRKLENTSEKYDEMFTLYSKEQEMRYKELQSCMEAICKKNDELLKRISTLEQERKADRALIRELEEKVAKLERRDVVLKYKILLPNKMSPKRRCVQSITKVDDQNEQLNTNERSSEFASKLGR